MNSVSDPYSMDELDTEVDFLNRDHGTSKVNVSNPLPHIKGWGIKDFTWWGGGGAIKKDLTFL